MSSPLHGPAARPPSAATPATSAAPSTALPPWARVRQVSGQLPPLAARCRRRAAAAPVPRSRSGCCTARPPAVAPRRVAVARPRSTHSALTPYSRAARSFFSCAGVRVGVGETAFSYVHAHACMRSRAVTTGSVTRNIRIRDKKMFYIHSKGLDEAVLGRLLPSKTLRGIDFSYRKFSYRKNRREGLGYVHCTRSVGGARRAMC